MRLDFNVLWVEDQQANVMAQKEKFDRIVRAEGFRLCVAFAASVEEAKRFILDDVYGDHVDLILMDYNLRGGPNGDVGLKEVRQHMPYKDVIFYSAQGGNLRQILDTTKVDGIHLSNRDELPDVAGHVFETLIKKVVDIDHSRGIAMGITSEIDHYVNDCLLSVFERIPAEKQAAAFGLVQARLAEIQEGHAETASKIMAIKHLSELIEHHSLYTSNDRLVLLRKLLKDNGLFSSREDEEALKRYGSRTVPMRNVLAHVRVQSKGFSRKLIDRGGREYTSAEMKALRLELLAQAELFERLAKELVVQAAAQS